MEKTNEATPTARPWTYEERCSGIVITDGKDEETIIASFIPRSEEDEDECTDEQEANAELIVKAVNAYDSLVEEVQKLKEQYKILHDNSQEDIGNLMAENQKLRELLEKIKDSRELRFAKLRGELYHPLELEIASILTKAKNV
jgi:hypothetical protein